MFVALDRQRAERLSAVGKRPRFWQTGFLPARLPSCRRDPTQNELDGSQTIPVLTLRILSVPSLPTYRDTPCRTGGRPGGLRIGRLDLPRAVLNTIASTTYSREQQSVSAHDPERTLRIEGALRTRGLDLQNL